MGSHTNVKSHYNAVHVHLQASFCHSSFGVKIKLERSGDPIHIKGKTITASEEGIKALADTTLKTIGTADHVIYLVHDKRGEMTILDFGKSLTPELEKSLNFLKSYKITYYRALIRILKVPVLKFCTDDRLFFSIKKNSNLMCLRKFC